MTHKEALGEIDNLRKAFGEKGAQRVWKQGERHFDAEDGSVIVSRSRKDKSNYEGYKDGQLKFSDENTSKDGRVLTNKNTSYGSDGSKREFETNFAHDSKGNFIGRSTHSREFDSKGNPTADTAAGFDKDNKLFFSRRSELDENQKAKSTTEKTFDESGKLVHQRKLDANGKPTSELEQSFRADGKPASKKESSYDSEGKAGATSTTFDYDKNGNLTGNTVEKTRYGRNGKPTTVETKNYDRNGRELIYDEVQPIL